MDIEKSFGSNKSQDNAELPSNQITLNINFPTDREEISKKGIISAFFGQDRNYKEFKEEDEPEQDKHESSDDEEDISPIKGGSEGSLKTTTSLDEEDIEENEQKIQLKQKKIISQIDSLNQKLAFIDTKKMDIRNSEISEMMRKIEELQKESMGLNKIKEQLDDKHKNFGFKPRKNDFDKREQDFRNGKRKILMHKLRLKILEINRRIDQNTFEDLKRNTEENSRQKLDCDSYLFTSLIIEYFVFFSLFALLYILLTFFLLIFSLILMIFHPFLVIFRCSSLDKLKKNFQSVMDYFYLMLFVYCQLLVIIFFFIILLFPAIIVVTTQFLCINLLQKENYNDSTNNSTMFMVLKVLMVIFFFFLSMKEISSAIDAIAYFYKKSFLSENKKERMLLVFRICPQILQMAMCFWFCYINIYLIIEVDDTPNLIQNFAALAIVLEFDNYVMDFLRYMKFYPLYKKFINFFGAGNENNERKLAVQEKERKIKEYQSTLEEYKSILKSLRVNKPKNTNDYNPVAIISDVKIKLNALGKRSPTLAIANQINNESDNEKEAQGLSKFLKNLNSIFTKNVSRTAIAYLGRQEAIKVMLKEKEFPVDQRYILNKMEKMVFNWIGFCVVFVGIGIIVLVFVET